MRHTCEVSPSVDCEACQELYDGLEAESLERSKGLMLEEYERYKKACEEVVRDYHTLNVHLLGQIQQLEKIKRNLDEILAYRYIVTQFLGKHEPF